MYQPWKKLKACKLKRCCRLMLAIILLLLARPLYAQPLVAVPRFRTILSDQFKNMHLSSYCLTAEGELFLGTNDGLFKIQHEQLHKVPLPKQVNAVINSLLYHNGLVYMGTNAGIFTYDEQKGSTGLLGITGRLKDTVRSYCQLMRIDRQQRLFFYTGYDTSAYYSFDLQLRKCTFLLNKSDGFRDFEVDQQDALSRLWVVEPVGLATYDFRKRLPYQQEKYFYGGTTGAPLSIASIKHDAHSLWCATNKGLLQFNLLTHDWRLIGGGSNAELTDLIQYKNLVICGSGNGLQVYDTNSHQWQLPILHVPDDPLSLPGNSIAKLGLVKEDVLLVATNKGISFLLLDAANQFVYALPGNNPGDQLSWAHDGTQGLASSNRHFFMLDQFGQVKAGIPLQQSIHFKQALSIGRNKWVVISGNRCFYIDSSRCAEMKAADKAAVSKFEFITATDTDKQFIAGGGDGLFLVNVKTGRYHALVLPPEILFSYYQFGIAHHSILAANANYSYLDLFGLDRTGALFSKGRIATGCNINDTRALADGRHLLACNDGVKIVDWKKQQLYSTAPDFDQPVTQLVVQGRDIMLVTAGGLYRYSNNRAVAVDHPLSKLFAYREMQPVSLVQEQLMWSHSGLIYRFPLNPSDPQYSRYLSMHVRLNGTSTTNTSIPMGDRILVDVDVTNYHPFVEPTLFYNVSNTNDWLPVPKEPFSIDRLPAGKFILSIKATAGGVTWHQASYTITVVPAWHQTDFFKLLMFGLLLLGVCAVFAWIIIAQRRKSNEKLRLQKLIGSLETKALRSQMNPHFVFNTMNSINSAVIDNDTEKASECILQFSKLMRQTLDNSQHEFVTLDKELAALAIYLQLEQFRLDQAFQFKITIHDTVSPTDCLIPPLVLQPYVENAIWHGLVHQQPAGLIEITVTAASEYYQIRIADNGIGRAAAWSHQQSTADRKSHGTAITEQRLKLMNSRNSVEIDDLANHNGTVVLLTLFQPNA